jgi:hypothetical protein
MSMSVVALCRVDGAAPTGICTYYLPPIWGYFSTQWLSRKAYI